MRMASGLCGSSSGIPPGGSQQPGHMGQDPRQDPQPHTTVHRDQYVEKSSPPTLSDLARKSKQLVDWVREVQQKQIAMCENNVNSLRMRAMLNASRLAAKAELRTVERELTSSLQQLRDLYREKLGRKLEKEHPEAPASKRTKT